MFLEGLFDPSEALFLSEHGLLGVVHAHTDDDAIEQRQCPYHDAHMTDGDRIEGAWENCDRAFHVFLFFAFSMRPFGPKMIPQRFANSLNSSHSIHFLITSSKYAEHDLTVFSVSNITVHSTKIGLLVVLDDQHAVRC